jgi:4a-hydroxytetrahydrobiopterin dehydratase
MAANLADKTCIPCRGGIPPLEASAAKQLLSQAPSWTLIDDARRIERTFRFPNFKGAMEFVTKIGELAEAEGHHPDIHFGWGYATVLMHTHKIKDLHENDFIMAAKIDRLAEATASH